MDFANLPLVYLIAFVALLAGSAVVVLRQVLKNRAIENDLAKLEKRVKESDCTGPEYYALASIYLDKRLFVQAVTLLKKALKDKSGEQDNFSPVYNALGYAYESQEQYDLAIRHYKDAIAQDPGYVTAINNLGHAYEQKKLTAQALEMYEKALELEPANEIANRRATSLRRRLVSA
jgi:tetratricopeptide (TPR) repeat protein